MRPAHLVLLLSILSIATPALADWPAGGIHLASFPANHQARYGQIFDHPSGDLAVLSVGLGSSQNHYNVQRVTRSGSVAAGWPVWGRGLEPLLAGHAVSAQSFLLDEDGWFWRTWPGSTTNAEAVRPDGVSIPVAGYYSWTGIGLRGHAAPGLEDDLYVVRADGARLLRVTRDGTYPAGWTSTGISLPTSFTSDNAVLSDGHGGAVVFMHSVGAGLLPTAIRVDSNKVVHAGWPAGGLVLSSVSPGSDGNETRSRVLPSGPDHFIAAWSNPTGGGLRVLRMRRFGADGTLDPSWPTDGLVVLGPDSLLALTLLPDGSGGVYALQQLAGVPVATHVSSSGTFVGGPGVSVLDAGAQYVPTHSHNSPGVPDHLIADHAPGGGMVVGWGDTRLAPAVSFRVRWLLPDLTPDPARPDTGVVVFPASPGTHAGSMLAVHADGNAAAFVAWAGKLYETLDPDGQLWMTRVEAAPTVSVPVAVAERSRLALSTPWPNPALNSLTFDLTLPDEVPARIELIDVGGRRVRAQEVRGAGPRRIALEGLQELSPGLYFLRAVSGSDSRTVRVAIGR